MQIVYNKIGIQIQIHVVKWRNEEDVKMEGHVVILWLIRFKLIKVLPRCIYRYLFDISHT